MQHSATVLSARRQSDREVVTLIPVMKDNGIVIIDDFHRLDNDVKSSIADFAKILADEEDPNTKLILIGINRAGETLVNFAADLANRIDNIRFEANPSEKIEELISKGEQALNVKLSSKSQIVDDARGSFYITQMLCHHACILRDVATCQPVQKTIDVGIDAIKLGVLEDVSRQFKNSVIKFVRGPKFRPGGRGSYVHLLKWIAESTEWSMHIRRRLAQNPELRPSIVQILDKGFLEGFLRANEEFGNLLHYDPHTGILVVEDPRFMYFIRNINWTVLAKDAGFLEVEFPHKYDFALSFAGADRITAEMFAARLIEAEVSVFYDKNEQSSILAENVEEYLAPIYQSQARFVVVFLTNNYPQRVWTKFESDQFKTRMGDGDVIPIRFEDSSESFFSETSKLGSIFIDKSKDTEEQIDQAIELLLRKIEESRIKN